MPNYQSTYIAKDTDIDKVIEIFGGLLHQLNFIMNNMDSQNVKRINTNATSIKSEDGSTEIDGSQLVMYDANEKKRVVLGKNKRTGKFEFTLYKANGITKAVELNSNGDAVFSGDINTKSDAYIGDNIFIGEYEEYDATKAIKFFDDEVAGMNQKAVIKANRENDISHSTTMKLEANKIMLLAFEGVEAGVSTQTASDVVTAGNISRAYVEIGGTEYQVHWR